MSVPSLVYAHVYGQASFSNKKRPKTVPLPLHLIFSYFLCALYYSYRWRKSLCLISLRNFLPQLDDAYQVNRRQRVPELTAFRTFHDIRLSPFAVLVQTGTAQPETSKDSGTQPNGPPPRRRHRKLNSGVGRHVGSSSSENESHDKGRAGRAEVVVVGQLYPAPAPQLHARSCGSLTSTSICLRQMHYMRLGCISRLALFN
ncbi:hypothetical protein IWZ00DRAFT_96392 [Phyllosticta capitalensis]